MNKLYSKFEEKPDSSGSAAGVGQKKRIFTILYEVGALKYLIGVTNDRIPLIATVGVNTSRPFPQNVKTALAEAVKELKNMSVSPKVYDYNRPSTNIPRSILGNFSITPLRSDSRPAKSINEALAEIRANINKLADGED